MKRLLTLSFLCFISFMGLAQKLIVSGPDKRLVVNLSLENGHLYYDVQLDGKVMLEKSALGLKGRQVDLSAHLKLIDQVHNQIDERYEEQKIKRKQVHYQANELICKLENADKQALHVVFRVSNHDIAFRYHVPQSGEAANFYIEEEMSAFKFPNLTTTFLTPRIPAMSGWMKTKPSYEEEYTADEQLGVRSKYGLGYTFLAYFMWVIAVGYWFLKQV